jgi:hypothetical protein
MSEEVPTEGTAYHIWVNNKDTCRDTRTIEQAMALAIAYKFDGSGTRANEYFCKSIGIGD